MWLGGLQGQVYRHIQILEIPANGMLKVEK